MRNTIIPPKRDPYQLKAPRTEYQLFNSEYYSAADVSVMLDGILIDDVNSLAVQMSQEIMPLFGHNSYTADAFAYGQRSVRGAMSLNFKSVGYLNEVLKNRKLIKYVKGEVDSNTKQVILSKKEEYTLDDILTLYGKKGFDEIAEDYEKAMWGEGEKRFELMNNPYQPIWYDPDGYSIRIHYGPNWRGETGRLGQGLNEKAASAMNRAFYSSEKGYDFAFSTVETIVGVHFTATGKQIQTASGSVPVVEEYTFVAKDINSELVNKGQ
ncbi:hypothetical protein ACQR3P_28500 [Rhodococcus sp. IEGM1300]